MPIHAVAAHNKNVSRGTGLAPTEVHIVGRYPRLPITLLEGRGVREHQSLKQEDQLEFLELFMRDRQVISKA